jgi:SAM-dependent methyltransferase
MSLNTQYDIFYESSQTKELLPEVILNAWPRNRVEGILHSVGNGGTVIDIGCGNGYLLFQLKNKFDRLVGLEYSSHRLEQAKLNLAELSFQPILGSAEEMNTIESSSIDCIVSADTIEHIPDIYSAVNEMYRVLKPSGLLVINTPNIAFIKKRILLMFGRFPSTSQPNEGLGSDILFDGGHLHYFTFRSLTLLLEKAGFVIEARLGYGKFGRVHDFYPSLLSGGVQLVGRKP